MAWEGLCFDRAVTAYTVDRERCIACGACAILAPGVFEVVKKVRMVRPPGDDAERAGCAAAVQVCPTQAIAEVV